MIVIFFLCIYKDKIFLTQLTVNLSKILTELSEREKNRKEKEKEIKNRNLLGYHTLLVPCTTIVFTCRGYIEQNILHKAMLYTLYTVYYKEAC